ncbi:hypothetical protein, partial [Marmoricola sp. RAF53]|uniref:hypothetical protein n=1 Tax=Marmoricola sp. RAF53 TaxID=3233059 RepID=UPI003F9E755A
AWYAAGAATAAACVLAFALGAGGTVGTDDPATPAPVPAQRVQQASVLTPVPTNITPRAAAPKPAAAKPAKAGPKKTHRPAHHGKGGGKGHR